MWWLLKRRAKHELMFLGIYEDDEYKVDVGSIPIYNRIPHKEQDKDIIKEKIRRLSVTNIYVSDTDDDKEVEGEKKPSTEITKDSETGC